MLQKNHLPKATGLPFLNSHFLRKYHGLISKEVEGELEDVGHIHFCDGLRQICGNLREAFPTAIYDIVATGTSSRTV